MHVRLPRQSRGGKDLRFSDVWAEKFRLWQERVLAVHDLGGDLTTAIKNFAFAKQRFDSFCRPLIPVLCCLVPIVGTVVLIAEDPREDCALIMLSPACA